MMFEQNGLRIETLARIMREIIAIYDLANPNGIRAIKFFNAIRGLTNVTNKNWRSGFDAIKYDGITRIGNALKTKILEPFVWKTGMKKPLLVMIITDGDVSSQRAPRIYSSTSTNLWIKGGGRAERDVGKRDQELC